MEWDVSFPAGLDHEVIFRKKRFQPNQKTLERYRHGHVEKEKRLFLSLCSEPDAKMIQGESPMSVEDFDRIHYLIATLGLDSYSIYFAMTHEDLLNAVADNIEEEMKNGTAHVKRNILTQEGWIQDFLSQLPSEKCRKYIREIFSL